MSTSYFMIFTITQLYVSFRPDSFAAQDQAMKAIEICIADVRAWLVSNRLS